MKNKKKERSSAVFVNLPVIIFYCVHVQGVQRQGERHYQVLRRLDVLNGKKIIITSPNRSGVFFLFLTGGTRFLSIDFYEFYDVFSHTNVCTIQSKYSVVIHENHTFIGVQYKINRLVDYT